MINYDGLRSLYAQTAPFYEDRISPVFAPMASDLARWIVDCAAAHLDYSLFDPFDVDPVKEPSPRLHKLNALDLGTGTAVLARALSGNLSTVVALDLSAPMLNAAHPLVAENIHLIQADLHHLPLKRGAIQLAVSNFGLNASNPKKALAALAALLRRGEGMLAFQEWGVETAPSDVIDQVVEKYVPDEIPGLDGALRDYYAESRPWYDRLQDTGDYYEMLKQVGFDQVWVKEAPFVTVRLPSVEVFARYKLAWPLRRLAIAALEPSVRADLHAELSWRLAAFANADGSMDWSPSLFRVFASR